MQFHKLSKLATALVVATTLTACSSDNNNRNPVVSNPSNPGSGGGTTSDPFLVSEWFGAMGLGNSVDFSIPLNMSGKPTDSTTTVLDADFDAPSMWNSRSVPSYITDSSFIGALDPDGTDWTEGWTIGLGERSGEADFAVWDAVDGTAVGTPPGSCPFGTDGGLFSAVIGSLQDDDADRLDSSVGDMRICVLPARITTDVTLTNNVVWRINNTTAATFDEMGNQTVGDAD